MLRVIRGLCARAPLRYYSSKPWYVTETPKPQRIEYTLSLPANSPPALKDVCYQLSVEYGLENVEVLDARERITALGPAIMILGTGKSIRHLGRATSELKGWLKETFSVSANSEGTLTSNFVRTWRKRTKRRQERQRSYAPAAEIDPTLQRKTGDWIVVDTKLDSIYVHMVTADKRKQLDLESLIAEPQGEEPLDSVEEYAQPRGTTLGGRRNYSTIATQNNQGFLVMEKAVAAINGGITLPSLVAFVEDHLAAGRSFDKYDIKTLITAIAYHKHGLFEKMSYRKQTVAAWNEVCDEKAKAILSVCDLVTRPLGQDILVDDDIVLLLWRAFVSPCSNSINPTAALADPTPTKKPPRGFYDTRSAGFLAILRNGPEYPHPKILIPVLCGLLNAGKWNTFWSVLDRAGILINIPTTVVDAIIAMVVKTGNEKMIAHALTSYLPNFHRTSQVDPSPELKRAILSGLEVIDGEKRGYHQLRSFAN